MGCSRSRPWPSLHPQEREKSASARADNSQLLEIIQFLRATPLFRLCRQQDFPKIAAASRVEVFRQGDVVVRAGDISNAFFVIQCGEASAWMQRQRRISATSGGTNSHSPMSTIGVQSVFSFYTSFTLSRSTHSMWSRETAQDPIVKVANLRCKDFFGERAILWDEVWDRTIIADSEVLECIKITHDKLRKLRLRSLIKIPKRQPVMCRVQRTPSKKATDGPCKPREKDAAEEAAVREAFSSHIAFGEMLESNKELVEELVRSAWKLDLADEQVVVDPEENPSGCLYVVQAGMLSVRASASGSGAAAPDRRFHFTPTRLSRLSVNSEGSETPRILGMESSNMQLYDGQTPTSPTSEASDTPPTFVLPGQMFGEHTILYEALHNARVQAVGRSTVWALDIQDYNEAAKRCTEAQLQKSADLLSEVNFFSVLLNEEKLQVAKAFIEIDYQKDQHIYTQGEVLQTFNILLEGTLSITQDGVEIGTLEASQDNPNAVVHLGEHMLTKSEAHSTTVLVRSERARCLVATREALQAIDPSRDLLLRGGEAEHWRSSASSAGFAAMSSSCDPYTGSQVVRPAAPEHVDVDLDAQAKKSGRRGSIRTDYFLSLSVNKQVKRSQLKGIKLLGSGGFGIVELCEHTKTKELYALKTVKKAKVAKTEELRKQVLNEKYILEMTDSIFIIKLFSTDKSDKELYFVLEPALGGELYTVYVTHKLFGKEDIVRYHTASIIGALEHLHDCFVIYRDLKPENLLLDAKGRLKLTDMGIAKFVLGSTDTLCGTPIYMAPEVVKQCAYNHAVDWWQFGILVWELLSGRTPFSAQSRGEAFYRLITEKALEGLNEPKFNWPKGFNENVRAVLRVTLVYNPSQRLPVQSGGLRSLRRMAWFKGTNWEALNQGTMKAPYIPPAWDPRDKDDDGDFTVQETRLLSTTSGQEYVDDGSGWDDAFG